jgi:branched-chain amino acid transport system substrate-binding protein
VSRQRRSRGLDRRKLRLRLGVLLVAAVTLAAGLGASSGSGATGSPIRLGILTSLTGAFAPWGIQNRAGAALAVNEINRSGGVKGQGGGRLLNLVVADDQSGPNAGIDGFRRLTEQSHVVAIGGLIGSNVALATARLAEQAQVPMFLVKAGANEILTQDSRYVFRTCLPAADEVAGPIVQLAERRNLKSVGAIVADYAWGQSIKKALEAAFDKANIGLNVQVAPLTATDFTPYLRALGNVPLIVATGDPPGAGAILAQSGQLGMKAPVAGAYSPFSLTVKAAGTAAYGRWADFKCMDVATKAYQALAKRFLKTFPQMEFFEDDALAGYAYVKIVAEAIRNVGDDPKKIAAYVHSHTFTIPGYSFPLKWTAWGELDGPRIVFNVLTKGPPPASGLNAGGSWWPRKLSVSQPLTPFKPSS